MHKWFKIVFTLIAIGFYFTSVAQDLNTVVANNEGLMRSGGKIYVVLAIVITILTGLIIYLVRLDNKISKLEKGEL